MEEGKKITPRKVNLTVVPQTPKCPRAWLRSPLHLTASSVYPTNSRLTTDIAELGNMRIFKRRENHLKGVSYVEVARRIQKVIEIGRDYQNENEAECLSRGGSNKTLVNPVNVFD
jgi:hypothetical protein